MIKTLGTIVVTGTHIRNMDSETEHPVQVLKREDPLRTGLTGVADIVQSLIVANGQALNRNINNGDSGELRDLRSLGANRTLVLVNGQRWVSAVDGAVNLSAIPLSQIERIEVLKDGATVFVVLRTISRGGRVTRAAQPCRRGDLRGPRSELERVVERHVHLGRPQRL